MARVNSVHLRNERASVWEQRELEDSGGGWGWGVGRAWFTVNDHPGCSAEKGLRAKPRALILLSQWGPLKVVSRVGHDLGHRK